MLKFGDATLPEQAMQWIVRALSARQEIRLQRQDVAYGIGRKTYVVNGVRRRDDRERRAARTLCTVQCDIRLS